MEIILKKLDSRGLLETWKKAFKTHGISRSDAYFERCFTENKAGQRLTLLAFHADALVGYGHLLYVSEYPSFVAASIPEINDLGVFTEFRKKGIGNRIIQELEDIAKQSHPKIGIGVGLYKDYGAAQRLYCRRGYIPDGNGITYANQIVAPGQQVRVDDDLVIYLTKDL